MTDGMNEYCGRCRFFDTQYGLTDEAEEKTNQSGFNDYDFTHRTICRRYPEHKVVGSESWCGEFVTNHREPMSAELSP